MGKTRLTLTAHRKKRRLNPALAQYNTKRRAEKNEGDSSPQPLRELPNFVTASASKSRRTKLEPLVLTGRRIVNISDLFEQLKSLNSHSPIGCTLSNMEVISEKRQGLKSSFVFQCNMCNLQTTVCSERNRENVMDVNSASVCGTVSTGGGHSQMEEFLGVLNIPQVTNKTFKKHEEKVSLGWAATAAKEMEEAAEEEARLARQHGEIDKDGVPLITVVADGACSKRSYRTNYSSLSDLDLSLLEVPPDKYESKEEISIVDDARDVKTEVSMKEEERGLDEEQNLADLSLLEVPHDKYETKEEISIVDDACDAKTEVSMKEEERGLDEEQNLADSPSEDIPFIKCEVNDEPLNMECDEDESEDSSSSDHFLAHFSCETVLEDQEEPSEGDEESTALTSISSSLASPDTSLSGYENTNPKKGECPFKCTMCCKTFRKKTSLENHLKTHKTITCEECQKTFTSARALRRHKQCVHSNKERPFTCEICDKTFTADRYLKVHAMIHTVELTASCDQCGKFFKHKSSLRKHAIIHQVVKPFNCSICSRSFSQKQHLNDHLRIHSEDKPFSCEQCGKRFKQKQALHSHKQTHLGLSLNCSMCGKSFKKRSNLISHMGTHIKRYKCKFCKETFNCKPELRKHEEQVHLGMEYKKPKCSLCALEFDSPELLNNHFSDSHPDAEQNSKDGQSTNSDSKETLNDTRKLKIFTCFICKKRYKRRNTLLEHLQAHSRDGKLYCKKCKSIFPSKAELHSHVCGSFYSKHFECTECSKVFSSIGTLRKHKIVHSGLKPFSCTCGKRFNQKSNLEMHKLTHLSEKPFKCPTCFATFAQRANLNYHELTHTGEYPFKCNLCNRLFRRKSYFIRHKCTDAELRPLSELVETVLICEETCDNDNISVGLKSA